jgi:hypothetical protein
MHINPYNTVNNGKGEWLKGNFHTHAGTGIGTCGVNEIDDVVAAYKDAQYSILTISNHDLFTDTKEFQSKHDIVMVNGFEYSAYPHMLCIGVNSHITGGHQEAIDECVKQGGIAVLCHPNWQRKEYWPWEDMLSLKGFTGIEIYNGVIFRLNGTGLATDTWDYLLSQGKLIWGFGNDDFHKWYDLANTWNMIYSTSKSYEDIKLAIKSGCFYTSTGLILNEFTFNDGVIRISARAKDTYVKNNTYYFIGKDGIILDEQFGEYGLYHIRGDEMYIRVQVISEHGAMLWTQPIVDSEKIVYDHIIDTI